MDVRNLDAGIIHCIENLQQHVSKDIQGYFQEKFTSEHWKYHKTVRWYPDELDERHTLLDVKDLAKKMGIEEGKALKKARAMFNDDEMVLQKAGRNTRNSTSKQAYLVTIDQALDFAMTESTEKARFLLGYLIANFKHTVMYKSIENQYKFSAKVLQTHSDFMIKNNSDNPLVYLTIPHQVSSDSMLLRDGITVKVGFTYDIVKREKSLKPEIGDHTFIAVFPCPKAKQLETQVKKHPEFILHQRDLFINGKRKTEFFTFSDFSVLDRIMEFLTSSAESQLDSYEKNMREKIKKQELKLNLKSTETKDPCKSIGVIDSGKQITQETSEPEDVTVRRFWQECTVRAEHNTTLKAVFEDYRDWLELQEIYQDKCRTKLQFQKKIERYCEIGKKTLCKWPKVTTETAILNRKLTAKKYWDKV